MCVGFSSTIHAPNTISSHQCLADYVLNRKPCSSFLEMLLFLLYNNQNLNQHTSILVKLKFEI
jgi:hypothetical protein